MVTLSKHVPFMECRPLWAGLKNRCSSHGAGYDFCTSNSGKDTTRLVLQLIGFKTYIFETHAAISYFKKNAFLAKIYTTFANLRYKPSISEIRIRFGMYKRGTVRGNREVE